MEINSERLVLAPLGTQYFKTTLGYSTDLENTKYMVFLPLENREEVRQFLENAEKEMKKDHPTYYEFAIILNHQHIGAVSVYFDDSPECGELGWILAKEYWGNGYVCEAAKAIVKYFAEEMNINHFIAHCDSENYASRRVMEKLGMHFVRQYGGRKNRSSDEMREECLYELMIGE